MAIYIGTNKVKDIYLGARKVKEIYSGNDSIYNSTRWKCVFSGNKYVIPEDNQLGYNGKGRSKITIPGFSGDLTGKNVQIRARAVGGCFGNENFTYKYLEPVKNQPNPSCNTPWTVSDLSDVFGGEYTLCRPVSNYIEGDWAYVYVHGGYIMCFELLEVWIYE